MVIRGKTTVSRQLHNIKNSYTKEFAFIKQRSPYAKIIDISDKRTDKKVTSNDSKYKKKNIIFGHTHPYLEKSTHSLIEYMVPSAGDIGTMFYNYLNNPKNYSEVISIRSGKYKEEMGRVHMMFTKETIEFLNKFLKNYPLPSKTKVINYLHNVTGKDIRLISESFIGNTKTLNKYKKMLAVMDLIDWYNDSAGNRLYYLANNLKIKFRFVANKKKGYEFSNMFTEFFKNSISKK